MIKELTLHLHFTKSLKHISHTLVALLSPIEFLIFIDLQITQKLTCINHVDLLKASSALNVNDKI